VPGCGPKEKKKVSCWKLNSRRQPKKILCGGAAPRACATPPRCRSRFQSPVERSPSSCRSSHGLAGESSSSISSRYVFNELWRAYPIPVPKRSSSMPTVASGRRTLGLHVDALAGGDWRFEALYSRTRNMRTSLTRASRTQDHAMQFLSVKPSTGAGAEAGRRRCDEQLGSLGDVCEQPVDFPL
jgi:hypothetical protein